MKRRSRRDEFSVVSPVVAVPTAYLIVHEAWVSLGALWSLFIILWLAFFKKTVCDVQLKGRRDGCGNDAFGHLRACRRADHKRAKRDALFALFGLTNPTRAWRIMWARSGSSYGRVSPTVEPVEPRITRPWHDGTILVATVAGSIAAVVQVAMQLL